MYLNYYLTTFENIIGLYTKYSWTMEINHSEKNLHKSTSTSIQSVAISKQQPIHHCHHITRIRVSRFNTCRPIARQARALSHHQTPQSSNSIYWSPRIQLFITTQNRNTHLVFTVRNLIENARLLTFATGGAVIAMSVCVP